MTSRKNRKAAKNTPATATATPTDPHATATPVATPADRRATAVATDPRAIAVVGMACVFPQAPDLAAYWTRLREGHDCVTEVPPSRFDIDAYYDPRPGTPGTIITRHGGFLDGIDAFDAGFFGVAPREAQHMDPQQRLLLETAAVAVADAGLTRARLTAGRTGVFIGSMGRNYWESMSRRGVLDVYANAGTAPSMLSGRLSYAFDLRGPSLTLDTACSSSLTAVHMACRSLRDGESTLALAGGVNLVLTPEESITFSDGRMLSPDGRCRFASAAANGFVRSEGVGVVVLKPLAAAVADGDAIRAVILGSAVVNDGQGANALMAPAESGQRETLRAAYADAGVDPAEVDYVEAHGTGTPVGDPVELGALAAVLGEGRPPGRPLLVGSAKTNIGHSEGAAGIAGLIKTVLALEHGVVPPSLHSEELTSAVDWPGAALRVPREAVEWPRRDRPGLAGVSSFGISGTNVHVVVGAHQPVAAGADRPVPVSVLPTTATVGAESESEGPCLLTLSSHLPETLREVARDFREFLTRAAEGGGPSPRAICASAALRRDHRESRLTVVGSGHRELADRIGAFLADEPGAFVRSADEVERLADGARVVFVFPGQGSQWVGMGRELLRTEPVFRRALEECDTAIAAEAGWSVVDLLTQGEGELEGVAVIQPTLWAMEVALAALWRSWGLDPDAVVGHSMGEVAAACVAGSLSVADGAAVICRRSALARRVSGRGAMASVELSAEEAERELKPYDGQVVVAAVNGPSSTILSGDADAMREVLVALQKRGVFCRLVRVDFASHGPQVEPLREPLLAALESLRPRAGDLPMYSTVGGLDGAPVDGRTLDGAYWAGNLRQPVHFGPVVQRLLDEGPVVFVEVSPHPILVPAMREYVDSASAAGAARDGSLVVGSTRRNEPEAACLLDALATIHLSGQPVGFDRLFAPVPEAVRLPGPAWDRQRYWFPETANDTDNTDNTADTDNTANNTDRTDPTGRVGTLAATTGDRTARTDPAPDHNHPLLGPPVASDTGPVWEGPVDLAANAYLRDHQVQGVVVVPGTAYVELVVAAASGAFGALPVLRDVTYRRAIYLDPSGPPPVVRVALVPGAEGAWSFEVSSRFPDQPEFTRNADGGLEFPAPGPGRATAAGEPRATVQGRCRELTGEEFYGEFAAKGNQWLGAFRGVTSLWRGPGEALARIEAPPSLGPAGSAGDPHHFHPALLDACGHTLAAAMGASGGGGEHEAFVLGGIARARLYRRPGAGPLWSHAVRTAVGPDAVTGTVTVRDEEGALIAELEGVALRFLEPRPERRDTDGWLHDLAWRPAPPAVPAPGGRDGYWLLFAGAGPETDRLADRLGGRAIIVTAGTGYGRTGPDRYRIAPDAPEEYRRLLTEVRGSVGDAPCEGVVHLWARDARDPDPAATPEEAAGAVADAQRLGCHSVLRLVRALDETNGPVGRLSLVTEGAQRLPDDSGPVAVGQATLWGFGRSLAQEYRRWRCTLIDLPAGARERDVDLLADELLAAGFREDQIALRGGGRRVPRLVRRAGSGGAPERTGHGGVPEQAGSSGVPEQAGSGSVPEQAGSSGVPEQARSGSVPEQAGSSGVPERATPAPARYEIRNRSTGLLDAFVRVPVPDRPVGPGEVGVRVTHTALNYRDVLTALGAYPGLTEGAPLGWECAGVVTALGAGVAGLRIGDEVIALAEGALASHVVTSARLVARVPARLSVEEALTLPAAYLTAYYGLCELAALAPGERVLIHCATGGVGLAAVQLARWRGAEVYATAGSPSKRALLKAMGVRHVADSRSLEFAAEFADATRGEGMDVILNSLTGEAIARNLSLLAPYGRYVELSKKDLLENGSIGLEPFSRGIAFHSMDLVEMLRTRPRQAGALFERVLELVECRAVEPLPYERYEGGHGQGSEGLESAFRRMARARHTGKVLVRLGTDTSTGTGTETGAGTDTVGAPRPPGADRARPDEEWTAAEGTYLITGGLGGIGAELAAWLVERGARDLLLVGRGELGGRGPLLDALSATGARVAYRAVDIADETAVRALLREYTDGGGPPVRGVLHAAGVIELASAGELTPERFDAVVRPKVLGGWALHRALEGVPLDFFALFSSASSVLGSPRLGAYAAANAGLDALAHHRRARGLPALSVNWGFWSSVGMVARYTEEHGRDLAPRGFGSFTPREAIGLLQRLLAGPDAQVTVIAADWDRWRVAYPEAARDALLTEVVTTAAPAAPGAPRVPDHRPAAPPTPLVAEVTPVTAVLPAPPAGTAGAGSTAPAPAPAPGARPADGGGADAEEVHAFLKERVARVLALPSQRLNARKPLNRQGLDSLMATEVRGEVQRAYEVTVPLARILGGQSLTDLAEFISGELAERP
ncbi:SDR family NAD(P)-dependent oxidoreductase [Streptomyces sp. NPDC057638]|uniref:SDR family NAD(P)-dependent oxidoreductase n=1 Tax=Streptomyces sp. NPDC057638 TaxID=3346190 RepID=UPI00367A89D4